MTAQTPQMRLATSDRLTLSLPPDIPVGSEGAGMPVLRVIRRRLWLILGLTVLATGAAVPVLLSAPRDYTAQTRLLVNTPLAQGLVPGGDGVDGAGLDVGVETERLHARSNLTALVDRLDLASRAEFNPALRPPSPLAGVAEQVRGLLHPDAPAADAAPPNDTDRVLDTVDAAIWIHQHGGSNVVDVGFTSEDPVLAAAAANALVDIHLAARNVQRRAQIDAVRDWLDERIALQQTRVDTATAELTDFESKNRLALLESSDGVTGEARLLTERRAGLVGDRLDLQMKITAIEAGLASGTPLSIAEPDTIKALRVEVQVRRLAADRLEQTYGSKYREVIDARAQITTAEAALRAALVAWRDNLKRQDAALQAQADDIGGLLTSESAKAAQLSPAAADRDRLASVVDTERAALDALQRQRDELTSRAQLPALDLERLAPATVPLYPNGQSRKVLLVGVMVAAAVASVTLALALELMDRSLRSPQQLAHGTPLRFAGFLPALSRRRARDLHALFGPETDPEVLDGLHLMLQAVGQSPDGRTPRSIAVTGAEPGAGAGFSARVLAMGFVHLGRPVLLVQMHGSATGPGPRRGVTALALPEGRAALASRIRHETCGLDTLYGGGKPTNPPSAEQIAEILAFAADGRRLVIFDCPPVLTSPAARQAIAQSDATVLVARWGRTPRRVVERAATRLMRLAGMPMPFLLVNAARPRKHARYGFEEVPA